MVLNTFDQESDMIPKLVRLHDSHKLYSLAQDKKPEAQAELSCAVSALIGIYNSPREEELIADVLIGLMRQAEKDLKCALADRLSSIEGVPLRLALHIANEEIDIARPMLQYSAAFSDLDLAYIIKSKGSEHWQIIAGRQKLADEIVVMLAQTRDANTVRNLLENADIDLTPAAMKIFIDMAQDSEDLARPLLMRPEVTNDIAAKIYVHVGQDLKRRIVELYEIPTDVLLSTLDEIVLEFRKVVESEFTPTKGMIVTAQRHKEKGLLTLGLMMSNLRRGQIQSFIAELSVYLNAPAMVVEEMLSQPKGNGLAIMCRAADIQKPDFVTIFLLTNRVRQKGRMVDVGDMSRAVGYYNKISRNVAEEILKSFIRKINN